MKKPKLNLFIFTIPFIFLITGFNIIQQDIESNKLEQSNLLKNINDFHTRKMEGHYVNNEGDYFDINLNNVCRIKINNTLEEGKFAVSEDGYFEYMTTEGILMEAMIHFKNERLIFALNDVRIEFRYKGPSKILDEESIDISNKASSHVDIYNNKLIQACSDLYAPSISIINN